MATKQAAPEDFIFTEATFQGTPGDASAIAAEMDKITASREATQPIKSRTGGSTFKNPHGQKAWQLIDAAGLGPTALGERGVPMFNGIEIPVSRLSPVRIDRLGPDMWMEADVHGHR